MSVTDGDVARGTVMRVGMSVTDGDVARGMVMRVGMSVTDGDVARNSESSTTCGGGMCYDEGGEECGEEGDDGCGNEEYGDVLRVVTSVTTTVVMRV